MATYIKILNNNDIKIFENPPQFNGDERKRFFYLTNWAEDLVKSFRTPTNQVGFILQAVISKHPINLKRILV